MSDDLEAVAQAVSLREGPRGVAQIIRRLARQGPLPTRTLSRATGLPVPVVSAVCSELRQRGIVAPERPARLSERGARWWAEVEGTGSAPPPDLGERLALLLGQAPQVRSGLDQSHCTVETKLRRVALAEEAGAVSGRSVLILGDDDLIGLTLALSGAAVARLTVVDVDPAILDFTRGALADGGPEVELIEHDLRRPLPDSLLGRFDTVLTDPPYTLPGAALFLSRAATALAPGSGAQLFLCFPPRPPVEASRVQAMMTGAGFAIQDLHRRFNEYLGAGVLGGVSDLYHLVSGGELRPPVEGSFDDALYTGEFRDVERAYVCQGCHRQVPVGPDRPDRTVEELRARGCPDCGGTVFRPRPLQDAIAPTG
jgi:predicted methyltransferase/DNA-directed RNA polymerase subunit RPC12/RpoP